MYEPSSPLAPSEESGIPAWRRLLRSLARTHQAASGSAFGMKSALPISSPL